MDSCTYTIILGFVLFFVVVWRKGEKNNGKDAWKFILLYLTDPTSNDEASHITSFFLGAERKE